jgi:hypothetical protein
MPLVGCATQGVNAWNYTAPIPTKIVNEGIIQKPYSQVWDGLVKEISKSFYVINNIDKESRIINLSFSTNSPADFVDCGKSHRTYTQYDKVEVFDYEVAGPSKYKAAGQQQPHPAWASYAIISREPYLEGRANIYIAPDEKDKNNTVVTINTRYIWASKTKGQIFNENVRGSVVSIGNVPESASNITFNTNAKGELEESNGTKLICVSKGKLESEILGFIAK